MSPNKRQEMLSSAATEALKTFDRPVLAVWASEDRIMPLEHGRRLAKVFPNSELVEIPDSFTLVREDQPALLVAHLRNFLATHRPQGRTPTSGK